MLLPHAMAEVILQAVLIVQSQTVHQTTTDNNTILGAGSTFIYPFFSKAFSVYNQQTGVKVNYQSIGSGGGILQLTNKTVDFGDSDAPLNGEQDQHNWCSCFTYSNVLRCCCNKL